MNNIPQMRTIKEVHKEIKKVDPNSSLTLYAVRQLVNTGKVTYIRRGRKILVDLAEVMDYLNFRKLPKSTTKEEVSEDIGNNSISNCPVKRINRFNDIF